MIRNYFNEYYVKYKAKRSQLNIYKSKFRQRISRWKLTEAAPMQSVFQPFLWGRFGNLDSMCKF